MKLDLAINHGHVLINKSGIIAIEKLNVGVKDSKIASFSSTTLDATQVINAKHLHILPGVIDTQVHFREPGLTHKEDLESGSASAAMGGVTSVFEMPNTLPPTTTVERLEEKFKLAQERMWVNYAFYGGASQENLTDLSALESTPGCSGIKIFMGSSFGPLLVATDEGLEKILLQCHRRVIVHAEDEARLQERKSIVMESHDVKQHHVWRDVESALLATERLLKVARKLNKKIHVLHVTTKEEIDLLSRNKDLATFEITPNHLTLTAPDCYERLGTLAQMNPPVREKIHQDVLWRAVRDGLADVIGTDHAPHTLEEKAKQYPQSPSGMPGVQTLVPVMLTHVSEKKLSLQRLVELICDNPRRIFGCNTKGRVDLGYDADFTIVDLKKTRTIENSWIKSRCGWTPFAGMRATGWPTHTIVGGHLVMENDQLLKAGAGQKVLFS